MVKGPVNVSAAHGLETSAPARGRFDRRAIALVGFAVVGTVMIVGWFVLSGRPSLLAAPPPKPAEIDGARAFGYLKQIFDMGPHPAGSETNVKLRRLVAKHFTSMGGSVRERPFSASDPQTGQPLEMVNLIASWFPDRKDRVLVAAHYDSRPYPDQEPDPLQRRKPFIGANDPAAGVALLMEISHHLNELPTAWGIDLVLLDGEELVYQPGDPYFLGSKAFAADYARARRARSLSFQYKAGILIDLIGGKGLTIKREPYSARLAPRLLADVWSVAAELRVRSFRREFGREVMDDHLALNEGGIPTIDIIDFDYPHWHRASDVPDNCDPQSLVDVGRVVTAWLARPPRR